MNVPSQTEEQPKKTPSVPVSLTKKHPNGIIEIRVSDLQKYSKELGVGVSDVVSVPLTLPSGDVDSFNYLVTDMDPNVEMVVARVGYIDTEGAENDDDLTEDIKNPGDILKRSIMRRLYLREAWVCGVIQIDQHGHLWIDVMPSDDIEATVILWIQPSGRGVEFSIVDPDTQARLVCCRITFDGSTIYYTPVDLERTVRPS